jgi:hypothetical protein
VYSDDAKRRFLSHVQFGDGCWVWTGGTNRKYGRFNADGKAVYAHRFGYQLWIGPIDDGLSLDHLCRNELCVKPSHLDPVDHRTNVLRGVGPTAVNASKDQCIYGHALIGGNVIWRRHGRRGCRTCRNERERQNRAERTLQRMGAYVCPSCGAGFDTPKGVAAHKGRRHGGANAS